jgi:signal peptidase II
MTADRRNRLILWGTAAVVIAADQLSKLWVLNNLPEYETVDVFPWLSPVLSFTRLTNTGVAFGLFPQFGDFFTLLTAVIIGVLILFHRKLGLIGWVSHLALGMQIGGALGNWIDRLLYGGSVVDFIDVNFWPFKNWPIFNLADASIVVGVTLLLIITWSQEQVYETIQQGNLSDA